MKKRFLSLIPLFLLLCLSLSICPAAMDMAPPSETEPLSESYPLIPVIDPDAWEHREVAGTNVTVEYRTDGTVYFSGSAEGTYPCALTAYETAIVVDIEKYSLKYDFDVEGGDANISFRFKYTADGTLPNDNYPISNSALIGANFDAGSGDLRMGVYTGAMRLTDLVNSHMNYKPKDGDPIPFKKEYLTEHNELIFGGIQFFSVNGGRITVRSLELVPNEIAFPPAVSSEPTVTEASSEDSSEPVSEVSEETSSPSMDPPENAKTIIILISAALAVIVIAVVIVLLRKKKE